MHKKKKVQGKSLGLFSWSKWRDSNSRLPVPETGALPPALHLDSFIIILKEKSFVKEILKKLSRLKFKDYLQNVCAFLPKVGRNIV